MSTGLYLMRLRIILYYTKLLISFHSPVKSHSRDTELLSNRNILLSLLLRADYGTLNNNSELR
uniref:Secreted protein n=1 Tax=Heterorhabditis bacteriophora TaxID=37862 RepID=A0A1I7X1N1_HETBA